MTNADGCQAQLQRWRAAWGVIVMAAMVAACGYPALPQLTGKDATTDGPPQLSDSLSFVCGDGQINMAAGEVCDDFNTEADACGTCVMNCGVQLTAKPATGSIKADAGSQIPDGDNFTIDDGFGQDITFEFDKGGMAHTGTVAISYFLGDSASTIGTAIQDAINSSGLGITALFDGTSIVNLTQNHISRLGNKAIIRNMNLNNPAITSMAPSMLTGMLGGVAGDCATGKGCRIGADCQSNTRNTTTHTCN